jgi:putative DNA primase/helicase
MSLRPIVQALGGDLYGGGRRANVPAPGHSAADRSVSLLWREGRVIVHSFGGADWREVLDDLRRRGLIGADNRLGGSRTLEHGLPEISAADRLAAARRLWAAARPLDGELSGPAYVRLKETLRET